MFLKNILIRNYRSIQNAKVNFKGGLNILIGKNGVGKSNLLKYINQNVSHASVFRRVQRGANVEFEYTVCFENENDESKPDIELTVYLKREKTIISNELDFNREIKLTKSIGEKFIYKDKYIENSSTGVLRRDNDEVIKDFDIIKRIRKSYIQFEIPSTPQWLETPARYTIDSELDLAYDDEYSAFTFLLHFTTTIEFDFIGKINPKDPALKIEGLSIAFVKDIFLDCFERAKKENNLDTYLSHHSPISDFRLNQNINIYYADNKILIENLILEFRVNDAWIPWGYLSDGTKRLFYLISQCLSFENGILLIEEPELGIHPHQLYSLMEFIKEQSYHKQIIISTHSPIVLDILSPKELDCITIVKLTASGTEFLKLTEEQIDTAKEYIEKVGDLSSYWLHSDLENE